MTKKMREWCGCGAGIHGTVDQVSIWRTSHRHDMNEPPPQVPPTGAESRVETSYADINLSNHVGFQPR